VFPNQYHECHHIDDWGPSLKAEINQTFHSEPITVSINNSLQKLPFNGGWVGVVSYEAASFYKDFEGVEFANGVFPKMIWAYYPSAVILHHKSSTAYWVSADGVSFEDGVEKAQKMRRRLGPFRCQRPRVLITKADYQKGVETIQGHIRDGDIYQGNFTYPLSAKCSGDLMELYGQLCHNSPAPFSVFFDTGKIQVCGASPEEFVRVDGDHVRTRPIKGTIARHSGKDDETQKKKLKQSSKNNAELLMITDLERNDLGRICRRGTVRVSQLNAVETYSHLHHLVSTIEGELDSPFCIDTLLSTLFPGGSITGAPKIRATEILARLETNPRNVYTGVMGYISAQQVHFNISIRTLYTIDGELFYHVGGGIVADSEWKDEWEETMLKGKGIAETLDKWL
jgi:para-aminobenzoate synthetase component 1